MSRLTQLILLALFASDLSQVASKYLHEGHVYNSNDAGQELKCNKLNFLMADFNGDGREDFLCNDYVFNSKPINDYYALASLAGTYYEMVPVDSTNWCSSTLSEQILIGDVNGDGRADMICRMADGETYEVRYYEHHKFSSPTKMHISFNCDVTNGDLKVGDINADGVDDFVCVYKSAGTVSVFYNSHHHRSRRHSGYSLQKNYRRGYEVDIEFCVGAGKTVHLGDLNGDRAMDLVCHDTSDSSIEVALADKYDGFTKPKLITSFTSTFYCSSATGFRISDINGDGLVDLYCDNQPTTGKEEEIQITDSKLEFKDGLYFGTVTMTTCDFTDATAPFKLADVNGDRKADLVCLKNGGEDYLIVSYAVYQS